MWADQLGLFESLLDSDESRNCRSADEGWYSFDCNPVGIPHRELSHETVTDATSAKRQTVFI